MDEITFQVQRDEQSGFLAAWWDDSDGAGGITTQGQDLRDLQPASSPARKSGEFRRLLVLRKLRTNSASEAMSAAVFQKFGPRAGWSGRLNAVPTGFTKTRSAWPSSVWGLSAHP